MPTAVAAAWSAAAATVGESILAEGFLGAVAETIGTTTATALAFAGNAAASAGVSYAVSAGLSSLLSSGGSGSAPASPASEGGAFAAAAQARTHMLRTTVANRNLVYGRAMVSGPIVFATSNDNFGTLHMAVALAHGECEAIDDIYFNDEPVGALDGNGYPTGGRYHLATQAAGNLTATTQDNQGVNREPPTVFQYHYVTLPQPPLTISITDGGLTTANSPTGTPFKDAGGTWTDVGYNNVASGMRKNYPNDPGPGYIPWRQFGVNGNVVKMSASHSEGGNITITYTTTSGTQSFYVRLRKHTGAADQTVDEALLSAGGGWTTAHRLRGIPYLVASLSYNKDIFPRGIPNIKAMMRGKKLYDPRTTLTAWSDNPALVALDYLTADYGYGCPMAEIDLPSFIAAANICDELVTVDGVGTQQKRYTCNGVVDTGQRPPDVLAAIMSSMGGMAVWQGGKWMLYAGAYVSPTGDTLTADHLRGPLSVAARVPRADVFNAIKGTFIDKDRGYLPQDFPIQRNSTYVSEDDGVEIVRDLTLPMTTDSIEAQRLAKMAMDRARQGIVIKWPGKVSLLSAYVGQVRRVTIPHLGWTDKEFRIIDWTLSETGAVDLLMQEEAAASYSWNYGYATLVDPAPDTSLPDPWNVPTPTGLAVSSGTDRLLVLADGTIISRMLATWTAAPVGIVSTDVRYRRTTDSAWAELNVVDGFAWMMPVEDGATYIVQARHVGALGYKSLWATIDHTVVGKSEPPSNVSAFSIDGDVLAWTHITDPDRAGYRIRFHYGQDLDWGTAAPLHGGLLTASPYTMSPRPAGAVTLLIKAEDTSGNPSAQAAYIITDLGDPDIANIVETIALDPTFDGSITGGTVSAGDVVADALDSFYGADAASFYGADTASFYDVGGYAALSFVSSDIVVGTALAGSLATISATTQGTGLAYDYRMAGPGSFYGPDADSLYGADADPFYGPPGDWQTWPGQIQVANDIYNLRVSIAEGTTEGRINTLAIIIDAPDMVEDLADVAIAAAGTTIPYTQPFTSIQVVHATLQANGSGAETVEINKTSPLAPSIKAYNSSHVAVSGATADIRLKGY